MSKRKLDIHGLPEASKVWIRYDSPDLLISRNDGAKASLATRIWSYCLENTISGDKGHLICKKSGTTPGGRRYECTQTKKDNGQIYRKIEVFDWTSSHIKVKCYNGEKAKVVRKYMDSCMRGILQLGDQITQSYATPRS